jgi:DNA-binding winged helix-turn-helix (wHTH) protein
MCLICFLLNQLEPQLQPNVTMKLLEILLEHPGEVVTPRGIVQPSLAER